MVYKKEFKKQTDEKRCNKCGSAIWELQISGVTRKLSVTSLDVLGELIAKLAGKQTFEISKTGGKLEGRYRDVYKIKAPRKPKTIINTEHQCGTDYNETHTDHFPQNQHQIPEEPEF